MSRLTLVLMSLSLKQKKTVHVRTSLEIKSNETRFHERTEEPRPFCVRKIRRTCFRSPLDKSFIVCPVKCVVILFPMSKFRLSDSFTSQQIVRHWKTRSIRFASKIFSISDETKRCVNIRKRNSTNHRWIRRTTEKVRTEPSIRFGFSSLEASRRTFSNRFNARRSLDFANFQLRFEPISVVRRKSQSFGRQTRSQRISSIQNFEEFSSSRRTSKNNRKNRRRREKRSKNSTFERKNVFLRKQNFSFVFQISSKN